MGRKSIDQWSLYYWMTKNLWAKILFNFFYKKIELKNVGVIPRNKPVIIAPNHQNALMDAMALVTQLPFQTVFMARADIFKSPVLIKVLTFLKILPIYRIRDGISSLSKNEVVFDVTREILKNSKSPLCLFPEGNHGNRRRLRPLVKGIFRIAFKAQEDYKENPGVIIIPVGIDYSNYQKFGQTLFINFGEPIEVSEYWDLFEKNQALGTNALRDRLADEMSKCMIDIQTEEYYNTYMGLRNLYRPAAKLASNKLFDSFKVDKELIDKLDKTLTNNPEVIKSIDAKYTRYAKLRDKLDLRDWVFRKEKYSIVANLINLVVCAVLSPLFLLGVFNNWPHFFIPMKLIRKVKDPQFKSTMAWASAILIQPLFYLMLVILAIVFIPNWWLVIVYIVMMPVSGIAAVRIRTFYIKTLARLRFTLNRKSSNEIKEAVNLRIEILDHLDAIVA